MADLAQANRPELKVLLATGYAEGSNVEGYLAPNMEIITKPFAIDALANKISEMLNPGGEGVPSLKRGCQAYFW